MMEKIEFLLKTKVELLQYKSEVLDIIMAMDNNDIANLRKAEDTLAMVNENLELVNTSLNMAMQIKELLELV